MEKKLIIGLSGLAGSGKDHSFAVLRDALSPKPVVRRAFADLLRFELEAVLGSTLPAIWSKPYSPEVRWILQHYGTEYRRSEDPDYWLRRMEEAIAQTDPDTLQVVTDVRYQNEADLIRAYGGLVLEVKACDVTRADRLGMTDGELARQDAHASEVVDFKTDAEVWSCHGDTIIDGSLIQANPGLVLDYVGLR